MIRKNRFELLKVSCKRELILMYFIRFLGKMGRDEAKEILEKTTDGTFLVRESTTVPGQYALSLK